MRRHKGFSLIELLIVVAVFLVIAAIAVPNLIKSRMRANEASAVASIRMINTAAITYSITYPNLGYPAQLSFLGGVNPCIAVPAQACLIDNTVALGTKAGYSFVWVGDGAAPSVSYILTGTPLSIGTTGQTMFCTDQTNVIHYDTTGAGCTNVSPTLQ